MCQMSAILKTFRQIAVERQLYGYNDLRQQVLPIVGKLSSCTNRLAFLRMTAIPGLLPGALLVLDKARS